MKKKDKVKKIKKANTEVLKTEVNTEVNTITPKKRVREEFPVIELSDLKPGFHHEIIDVFNTISKPFKEGKGEKEAIMLDMLSDYGAFYEEKVGIIVPALTKEPKRVVVSHIDLISPFNRGFAKGKVYSLGRKDDDDIIIGALDNTITNAVVMLSIFELRAQGLAEDVCFLFTEGEEIDFLGMKAYLRKYSNKPLFINLDVTNDNCKFHTSIEFDNPNWSICNQINQQQDRFTSGFTTDRVCDDTDAVIAAKGQGFSYCIPTWKTIHSYKNYTLVDNLVPYFEGLKFLIHELEIGDEKSYQQDFDEISMKKALSCTSQKEVNKAEKKAKKKAEKRRKKFSSSYNYSSSNYHGRRPTPSYYPSSGWGSGNVHDVSKNDFDIYSNSDEVEDIGQGKLYYDYGNNIISEEDMLNNMMNEFDSVNVSNHQILNGDDDSVIVNESDIHDLEEVINSANVAATDYLIDLTDDIRSFISESVMARTQWTIDDLAKKTDSLKIATQLIEAFIDYFVLDTIENGVYQFKSACICYT